MACVGGDGVGDLGSGQLAAGKAGLAVVRGRELLARAVYAAVVCECGRGSGGSGGGGGAGSSDGSV